VLADNFKWTIDGRKSRAVPEHGDEVVVVPPLTEPTATAGVVKLARRQPSTMHGSPVLGHVHFVCSYSRQGEVRRRSGGERVAQMESNEHLESMSPARLRQLAPCTCYIRATYSVNGCVHAAYSNPLVVQHGQGALLSRALLPRDGEPRSAARCVLARLP